MNKPFGMSPVDKRFDLMVGPQGPVQRIILASDMRGYAVGDLVLDTGATSGTTPIATAPSYSPNCYAGSQGLSVIVAISPGTPQAPDTAGVLASIAPGVKAQATTVWTLPVLQREFLVVGNGVTPARAEPHPNDGTAPYGLTQQAVEAGELYACLAQGPTPLSGRSALALDGASFRMDRGMVKVMGLAQGQALAPGAMYRVRFVEQQLVMPQVAPQYDINNGM